MPRRMLVCPIIGTGTKADPYRASVAGYGLPYVALIRSHPVTGAPVGNRALVIVGADTEAELQPVLADPAVRALPAAPRSTTMNALSPADRAAARGAAAEVGLDGAQYAGSVPLSTVVRDIGRTIDPVFSGDPRGFDLPAVPE